MKELAFTFHAVTIRFESNSPEILEKFAFDFSWFLNHPIDSEAETIRIAAVLDIPRFDALPPLRQSSCGPNFVTYDLGSTRFIDYRRKVLASYDFAEKIGSLTGLDEDLLYEKAYLIVLSRLGDALEARGLHRVHALGIEFEGAGTLVLFPSGSGKSTLARSLLEVPGLRILSEDTPLIDRQGRGHPFPFRLGITDEETTSGIPQKFKRFSVASEGKRKVLVSPMWFHDRIPDSAVPVKNIIVGKWTTSTLPSVGPASRRAAFSTLFRDCVVGIGIPQLIELFFSSRPLEFVSKGGVALSRLNTVARVAARAKSYELFTCADSHANAQLVLRVLGVPS